MIEQEIRNLADKLGKVLADAIDKHVAVNASTKGYGVTTGRGGNSNGIEGSGDIPGLDAFKRDTDDLSKSFKSVERGLAIFTGNKILNGMGSLFSKLSLSNKGMMDDITQSASEYAKNQAGMYAEVAKTTLDYIKAENTRLDVLNDTADAIDNYRKTIHGINSMMQGGSKVRGKDLKQLREGIKLGDKNINVLSGLTKAEQTRWEQFEATGGTIDEFGDLLEKVSASALGTSNAFTTVSASVVSNMTAMTTMIAARMGGLFTYAGGLIAAGAMQGFNDTTLEYQAQISRQYKSQAIGMGMSNREVMLGALEFRDTLRAKAIADGTTIDDVSMSAISKLGDSFALRGNEAFRFGMQLHETSKLIGQTGEVSVTDMKKFYGESAQSLNMSVSEFGDYFNTIAQDPSFAGFVNTLSAGGDNLQDVITREVKTRIKMNKVMGLTNESLRERLALENSKKWAPLVDKYKAQVGSGLLANMFERKGVLDLDDNKRDILKRGSFDISTLSDDEKDIYQRDIIPALIGASSQMMKDMDAGIQQARQSGNKVEAARLSRSKAALQEEMSQYGQIAGAEFYNTDMADKMLANVNNIATSLGVSTKTVIQSIADGAGNAKAVAVGDTVAEKTTFAQIQTMLSKQAGEDIPIKDTADTSTGATLVKINETIDLLSGIAQSGAAKALLGVTGASIALAYQFGKLSLMMGMFTGKGGGGLIGGIKGAVSRLAGGSMSKTTGVAGVLNKLTGVGANSSVARIGGMAARLGGGIASAGMVLKDTYDVGSSILSGDDIEGKDLGGSIGGIVGGIVGMIGGPVGAAIGASIGNVAGGWIGDWLDDDTADTSVKVAATNTKIEGMQTELDKHNKLLDDNKNAVVNEPVVKTEYEQEMLDNSRKIVELGGKQLNATKEQSEELTGGFKRAEDARSKAAKSSGTWKSKVAAAQGAVQYK